LSTTVEVLASKFGDPDGLIEGVVPEFDIGLELGKGGVIPMEGNNVKGTVPVASVQHVLDPSQTVWSRGGSRADEGVALVSQGLDVRLPQVSTVFRAHVRLTRLVRFVHAHNVGRETLDNGLSENVNLPVTPKHRNGSEAQTLGRCWDRRSPGVQESLLAIGGLEHAETGIVTVGPGKTKLGSTRVSSAASRGVGVGAGAGGRR